MAQLNEFGSKWVQDHIAKIDEDAVYASIGAYDPDAFAAYLRLEKERLTEIALDYQDQPEFQMRNAPKV